MNDVSETLFRLKSVTYCKNKIDVTQNLGYGLVAEEVASNDPNLVACGKDGQIETVRNTAVNAMLLNEFLKKHKAFIRNNTKCRTSKLRLHNSRNRSKHSRPDCKK
jgi:hypothetical protein